MKNNILSLFGAKKKEIVNPTSYTKEFTYLPSYHWVQASRYTPATTNDPFGEAEYFIHNVKDTQVYNVYRTILVEDGWTITEEMPVAKFSAVKNTHLAHIMVIISENGVLLTIKTK